MKDKLKVTESQELFKEYHAPKGMRLSGNPSPEESFGYLQNMYIDREGGGDSIESIPGFRKFHSAKEDIHSIALQSTGEESYFLIHEGGGLYRLPYPAGEAEKIADVQNSESSITVIGDKAVITDGERLYLLKDGRLLLNVEEEFAAGCSCFAIFDGRLFLSGNKNQRGKIFYSSRLDDGEICLSQDNSISVGGEVVSLLSHDGRLWVFRSADEGGGAISCHNSEEGYPLCLSLSGVRPTGQVCSASGEILFLARDGLWSVDTSDCHTATRLIRLSSDVEPMLSKENIASARLTLWRDYAAIGCGEHIYLLDRRGKDEHGWYFLTQIGSHRGDRRVYRYSPEADEGYLAHKHTHGKAESDTISLICSDGSTVYYTEENGRKYSVYPTSEREGGDFSPAENLFSDGKLLCFSTPDGLFVFNTDMSEAAPEKYSFDGHAAEYVIATVSDDCGLPMTEKTSVGESLSLKITAEKRTSLTVSVMADGTLASKQRVVIPEAPQEKQWNGGARRTSLAERAHGWIEKQIVIEGREFCSPFGLSSLAFKFQPKEKLKKG